MDGLAVLIPIFALMIPISAVVLHSPLGKTLAQIVASRAATRDEELGNGRLTALEQKVDETAHQVQRVEEENRFLRGLLEDKHR